MRHLRKRLTCVNRGASRENAQENEIAIDKIIKSYIERMVVRGWFLNDGGGVTSGDQFFIYEAYVSLCKPNLNNQKDLDYVKEFGSVAFN